jgi:hypothetical protein
MTVDNAGRPWRVKTDGIPSINSRFAYREGATHEIDPFICSVGFRRHCRHRDGSLLDDVQSFRELDEQLARHCRR